MAMFSSNVRGRCSTSAILVAEAMRVMSAPAFWKRQESFPSWSMSKSCASCLSTPRRSPRALRQRITFSSSVVLPVPE